MVKYRGKYFYIIINYKYKKITSIQHFSLL